MKTHDPDPAEKAIEAVSEMGKLDGGNEALLALIAELPVGGGAIGSLLAGRWQRRMAERAAEALGEMNKRLHQVGNDKIDRQFFETDEFQTLFTLMLEQVQTTHDKEKLKMLGVGLANATTSDFSAEHRKELFFRVLRDLAPEHISVLKHLRPDKHYRSMGVRSRTIDGPGGEVSVLLQHLAASGIVVETLEVKSMPNANFSHPGAYYEIKRYLETPPLRSYRLSQFGIQFLEFLDTENSENTKIATSE